MCVWMRRSFPKREAHGDRRRLLSEAWAWPVPGREAQAASNGRRAAAGSGFCGEWTWFILEESRRHGPLWERGLGRDPNVVLSWRRVAAGIGRRERRVHGPSWSAGVDIARHGGGRGNGPF